MPVILLMNDKTDKEDLKVWFSLKNEKNRKHHNKDSM
jgi:hypothetical protein